jgi:hypothetical protein
MIFGSTEILICIVPLFLVIAILGLWLFIRKEDDGDGVE